MARISEDGDEAKLPKWAQSKLHQLRSRVDLLEQELDIAKQHAPKAGATGKVLADTLSASRNGFPLHDRCMVTFKTSSGEIDCMLRRVYADEEVLDINVRAGRMLIVPCAANCAYVKSE